MSETPQIAFVKSGAFSGTNAYVESILKDNFPGCEIHVIDILGLLRERRSTLLMLAALTLLRKPLAMFDGRNTLRENFLHQLWRTPRTFAEIGRLTRDVIRRTCPGARFILQTQSMWDSSTDGIPNFIYTDSAALTNLYYDGVARSNLAPPAWIAMEKQAFTNAARIFVWSGHVRRSLLEHYGQPEEKIVNVRAGCNLSAIPPAAAPAPESNKTILFVGVDWHRKGGPELIEAFRALPERHADARLIIVGCSPQVTVKNCTVVGRVPFAQVPTYYQQAAIFCMPTRIEPFGIAFIEAMAYSLAAVAPDHGAMPDYIRHRDTGMLHRPGDVGSIGECLTWLLDHPQERRQIAARGYEAVSRVYTWEAVGRQLREEIGKVVKI